MNKLKKKSLIICGNLCWKVDGRYDYIIKNTVDFKSKTAHVLYFDGKWKEDIIKLSSSLIKILK